MIDLVAQSSPGSLQDPIGRLMIAIGALRERVFLHADLRDLREVEFIIFMAAALIMFMWRNHQRNYPIGDVLQFMQTVIFVRIFMNVDLWAKVTSGAHDVANRLSDALYHASTNSTASQSELPMAFFRMFYYIELEFDFDLFGLFTSNPFAVIGGAAFDVLLILIGGLLMVIAFGVMIMLTFVFHVWVVFGYALLSSIGIFFVPFILIETTRPMFFAWLRLFLGTLLAWPFTIFAMMLALLALSALWDVSFTQFLTDSPTDPISINVSGITTIIPAAAITIVAVAFIIVTWRWSYQLAGAGAGALQSSFGKTGMGVA